MPPRSRFGCLDIFSKAQHHAALSGIDDIKATRQPDQKHRADQQGQQIAAARAAWRKSATAIPTAAFCILVAKQAVETLVEASPDLVQVGRSAVFVAVTVVTPLRVVPGHIVK